MFEKEAEKYATKLCCTDCKAVICKEKCECWTFAKKGAEFGYKKANEWHYMKDGDLPKIGEKVLSEKGDLVIYKGDGFWVEYSPNADNIKLRKWEEPRAWKEIVPPKEIEENEN